MGAKILPKWKTPLFFVTHVIWCEPFWWILCDAGWQIQLIRW